jgi:hypothetical protein
LENAAFEVFCARGEKGGQDFRAPKRHGDSISGERVDGARSVADK